MNRLCDQNVGGLDGACEDVQQPGVAQEQRPWGATRGDSYGQAGLIEGHG